MNLRCGKVIPYDGETGHRIKERGANWMHSLLKTGTKPTQCLFGEHLLTVRSNPVGIVESEKSAIVAALTFPRFTWMATGGAGGLSLEKVKRLGKRRITLFPDVDAHDEWTAKATEFQRYGCRIDVCDILKQNEAADAKTDIADWLLSDKEQLLQEWRTDTAQRYPKLTEYEKSIEQLAYLIKSYQPQLYGLSFRKRVSK